MKEDLIQFIWRTKLLVSQNLVTTEGAELEILSAGNLNNNQGPDFLFAKIRIDGILWIGHVEIHVRASDWLKHQHVNDPNYKNTILHVVWESDCGVSDGNRKIPCVELKNYVAIEVLRQYEQLMQCLDPVPCSNFLNDIPQWMKSNQLDRMMVERMEFKMEKCKSGLSEMQWNWEAMLYHQISHYLMAPVNSDAMDQLNKVLPYELISRFFHDPFTFEAMLYGTAGLLYENSGSSYHDELLREYCFLRTKYNMEPMRGFEWKLMRMRPAHFPVTRLAQLMALYTEHNPLFSKIVELKSLKELQTLLEADPGKSYAEFLHQSKYVLNILGKSTRDVLIINAVCPLLFTYGWIYGREDCRECSLRFLQEIKPESNHIVQMWKSFNFVFDHAGHSQGGIQLYHDYCMKKRCTSCSLGNQILKSHILQETFN